jgi:hypothetical protein
MGVSSNLFYHAALSFLIRFSPPFVLPEGNLLNTYRLSSIMTKWGVSSNLFVLKRYIPRCPWERDDIADITHAGNE